MRRSAVGATTQFHHELNHGETGKRDRLWGLKAALPVQPIHGGFGGHFMVVLVRFTVFWIHGGLGAWGRPKQRPPLDRHTHTRRHGLENLKDYHLLKKKKNNSESFKNET